MTNSTKFDECLALQIENKFGIIDEKDLQIDVSARAGYKRNKRSCKITKHPKVLHKVCCSKSKCNKWTKR